jgi:hypothetical protein
MSGAAKKRDVVVQLKLPPARKIRGHRSGFIVGFGERGPLVDFPGNAHGPLAARTTVPLDGIALGSGRGAVAAAPHAVLLVFEHERSDEPIVVGLLEPLGSGSTSTRQAPGDSPPPKIEAKIDGRRVVLEAEDELELRCGEATITLRRNGRVVIRGAYVETRSRGVNRIKGGSVQIN